MLDARYLAHRQFELPDDRLDFVVRIGDFQFECRTNLPLGDEITVLADGRSGRHIRVESQTGMSFRLAAQHETIQQPSLHDILEQAIRIAPVQALFGFGLRTENGRQTALLKETPHEPVRKDHQLGYQHPSRAFAIDAVNIDVAPLADPNVNLRQGDLHGPGLQTEIMKPGGHISQDAVRFILFGQNVHVVIGQLLLDLDQGGHDLDRHHIERRAEGHQRADGWSQMAGL